MIPKGAENIICTIIMYGQTFYVRHTAQHQCSKENKFWLVRSFGNKDYIKDMKIANLDFIESLDFYLR